MQGIVKHGLLLAMAGTSLMLSGCLSSSGDNAPALPEPQPLGGEAYNGPGSKWDVALNDDGTFHIDRRPDHASNIDLTIDGTWERNAMGFVLMTVSSATGVDAPSPGEHAWAVEAEGYALLLYTQGDAFVPMVTAGDCPTDDFSGNWVMARNRDAADASAVDQDWFGSFAFDYLTGAGSLPARHSLANGFPSTGSSALPGGTCSDGIMQVGDALMYLTNNGGAIVNTNTSQESEASFIFAMAQKQVSSITSLDAEYAGIAYDSAGAPGTRVAPVSLVCSQGLCSGTFVTDVAAMTTGGTFTLDLFGTSNAPVTGFLTGAVRDANGNSGNVACAVDEDVQGNGQRMVSCVGQAPGDNSRMFNLFFASNQ